MCDRSAWRLADAPMPNALKSYLRTYRRLWGLTQAELAYLLRLESTTSVSRVERQEREPTFEVAVASQIIFGAPPAELFSGPYSEIEKAVMRQAKDLYEKLQGDSSKMTRAKLDLLEGVFRRAAPNETKRYE